MAEITLYEKATVKITNLRKSDNELKKIYNTGLKVAAGDPGTITDEHAWVPEVKAAIPVYRSNQWIILGAGDSVTLTITSGEECAFYQAIKERADKSKDLSVVITKVEEAASK